ncbi:GNAT family N-acetyltransferase [Novosphingobium beihaiensis]|uniref:GNAT family N-acetyltransferase n=1 Tax=Novosphingobium beihaiensis TaxID=2930389 RepID=A0ABT0BPP1_9SPHN|nr:GNAT family N-acetyltransferase [Novosphingobium beihaiensis]MCJ2187025.1 GNAT family N-acetyltransferase [Novosphingobium beihaiensis]
MEATPIWRIRSAGPDDADALALISGATFLESFAGVVDGGAIVSHCGRELSAGTYRALFEKGARAWLAEVEPGHAPIGYALLCAPELDQAQPGDLELKRIYVLERFHGTVIGSALMRRVCEAAQGAARLLLGVKQDNNRALAFYRKHGFETIGTRSFVVGGKTYDDFVLARPLAN